METDSLERIAKKLDIIIRLLCSRLIEGKNKTDSILTLESVGVDRDRICELADCSPQYIRNTVHRENKKNRNKKKESRKKSMEAQPNEQPQ
jgi:hypothetical protein